MLMGFFLCVFNTGIKANFIFNDTFVRWLSRLVAFIENHLKQAKSLGSVRIFYFALKEQIGIRHVSLQSGLLALTRVDWEPRSFGPGLSRRSACDKNGSVLEPLRSAVCGQIFLAASGSVEFLSTLPSSAGAALPILHASQAQHAWANSSWTLLWPSIMLRFTSAACSALWPKTCAEQKSLVWLTTSVNWIWCRLNPGL